MNKTTKPKTLLELLQDVGEVVYSSQLEKNKTQDIICIPSTIVTCADKNNNSNQNVNIECKAIELYLENDLLSNCVIKLQLPAQAFAKMLRKAKAEQYLKANYNDKLRLRFQKKNKYSYELSSIDKKGIEKYSIELNSIELNSIE